MNDTTVVFQKGQPVRYSRPAGGEENLTFTVVEDRGDRVLIESRDFPEGTRFVPQEVVAKDEIEMVVPNFETRNQLREATLAVGRKVQK
jgi:hypothetical protein